MLSAQTRHYWHFEVAPNPEVVGRLRTSKEKEFVLIGKKKGGRLEAMMQRLYEGEWVEWRGVEEGGVGNGGGKIRKGGAGKVAALTSLRSSSSYMPSPSHVCLRSVGPLILLRGTGQAWYRRGRGASTGRIPVSQKGEEWRGGEGRRGC